MDFSTIIAGWKKDPQFAANVGMILIHNGIVRASSRQSADRVVAVEVLCDYDIIGNLCKEYESHTGIYKVYVKALSGRMLPGDDVLYILVAGDFRENVKAALSGLLDRIKAEAVTKKEIYSS